MPTNTVGLSPDLNLSSPGPVKQGCLCAIISYFFTDARDETARSGGLSLQAQNPPGKKEARPRGHSRGSISPSSRELLNPGPAGPEAPKRLGRRWRATSLGLADPG